MNALTDFCMPALGADMEKGKLLEWRVKPGDEVHRGQIVAEVDTAKSAIEIEVFTDGVVDSLVVPEGTEVPVGAVLARLRTAAAGEPAPTAGSPERQSPAPEPVGRRSVARDGSERPASQPPDHLTVTPLLRRLAEERHVDLAAVVGTGPHGRITRADIEHHRPEPTSPPAAVTAPPPPAETVPPPSPAPAPTHTGRWVRSSPLARRRAATAGVDLSKVTGTGPGGAVVVADVEAPTRAAPAPVARSAAGSAAMRQAIGKLMKRSKREIPHYYLSTTVNVAAAMDWLQRLNAERPVADRVLPVALLLKATALAASSYPEFNGHYVDGRFRPASEVRLGVPVALRSGGLITPAVNAAEKLAVSDLNTRLRDVATRAKLGKLRGSDLDPPSITVTSLGDQGVDAVFGVIFPPQVALVGLGTIVRRPWAEGDLVGVRPLVTITLSADHRVSDGHRGALFLNRIRQHLETPEAL